MSYTESLVATTVEEKRKQIIVFVLLILLPFVFAGAGFLLTKVDYFWAIFCWLAAALVVAIALIPKTIRLFKDDFYSHKIIYKGILKEIGQIKVGAGTASVQVFELVLEKKTLKISESDLVKTKLLDVPFPEKGEEVEIHALPKSGDVFKLLVKRNDRWESVALI